MTRANHKLCKNIRRFRSSHHACLIPKNGNVSLICFQPVSDNFTSLQLHDSGAPAEVSYPSQTGGKPDPLTETRPIGDSGATLFTAPAHCSPGAAALVTRHLGCQLQVEPHEEVTEYATGVRYNVERL